MIQNDIQNDIYRYRYGKRAHTQIIIRLCWSWLFRTNGTSLPGSVHVRAQPPLHINVRLVHRTQLDLVHCGGGVGGVKWCGGRGHGTC